MGLTRLGGMQRAACVAGCFLFLFLFLHAEAVLLALTDAFRAKIQPAWVPTNSVRCECARVSVNE